MRLLIVEDEKDLLESIAEGLRLSGYAVDTAADGAEAEDLFWSETYDLIVLDINLPKIDGFTLLEEIREEDKQVNVIMQPGYRAGEKVLRPARVGVVSPQ